MGNLFSIDEDNRSNSNESVTKSPGIPIEATKLRNEARQLLLEAKIISKQSQDEYQYGCRAKAKDLSNKKISLYEQLNRKNEQAANIIFGYYNNNRAKNSIDLHGLYVDEALKYLQEKLDRCRLENISELTVITGMGNHSTNGIAILRPKIEEFVRKNALQTTFYSGHVIIDLSSNIPRTTNECIIL
ncbi:hypothetical protein I4U23_005919 [Adineta vaga]|nr:hypothetical protein I4U23_005919 [Adineta vaga]